MISLAVDTTFACPSIAIAAEGKLLAEIIGSAAVQTSQAFFLYLSAALEKANLPLESISCLAAVTGPGSYTGLRVGLAAISGIAQSLNCPLLGVSILDIVALAQLKAGLGTIVINSRNDHFVAGQRLVTEAGKVTVVGQDCTGALDAIQHSFSIPENIFSAQNASTGSRQILLFTQDDGQRQAVSKIERPLASMLAMKAPFLAQSGSFNKLHPYY